MNMKKISNNETDLTQRIKNAKPVQGNNARTDELLLMGIDKSNLQVNNHPLARFRVALILTPLSLAAVMALSIFIPTQNPAISLDLKNFNDKQVSHLGGANTSVTADCAEVNKYCNDTGLLSQIKIDWQLSLAGSVSADAGQGHVYQLEALDDISAIATLLSSELGIDQPVKNSHDDSSNGFDYYTAGSMNHKYIKFAASKYGTAFDYQNPKASAWYGCQHNYIPEGVDCATTVFEEMPTENESIAYTKSLMSKIGITGGTNLKDLKTGDYLIKSYALNYGQGITHMGTRSQLVIDGFATSASEFQVSWTIGSNQVENVNGILYKLTDRGTLPTQSAKETYNRLNGYVTYGSFKDSALKLSKKSREGMSQDELERLYEIGKSQKVQTGVPVIVELTRAEAAPVTIIDDHRMTWIVPGYNFYDETGYFGSVMSLDDSYISMSSK
jgi:hypothetical protein